MLTLYSKVIGLPILELRTQQFLGKAHDIVIKKSGFSVYGVIIHSYFPIGKTFVISDTDILEIDNEAIIVNDKEAKQDLEETVRLKNAVESDYRGIRQKVVTKSGRHIGRVFDYLISLPDLAICKIYVKNAFQERIIPTSAIIEIEGKIIIVKDDIGLTYTNAKFEPETA